MANDTDEEIIMDVAVTILAKLAEIKTIREGINELKADIKGIGINISDFNFALKKFSDEPEMREASFASIAKCLSAMKVSTSSMLPMDMPLARKATKPETFKPHEVF